MEMIGILEADKQSPELIGSGTFTMIGLFPAPENDVLKVGTLKGGVEMDGIVMGRIGPGANDKVGAGDIGMDGSDIDAITSTEGIELV
jgi:hypothetical protein